MHTPPSIESSTAPARGGLLHRYVVWNTITPAAAQALDHPSGAGGAFLLIGNLEAAAPASVSLATRVALRTFLAKTDTGAEVVVDRESRPLMMTVYDGTPLEDLSLSVRSFHCLKAAGIDTLEELLLWTPADLLRLRHFGTRCVTEIKGLVQALGFAANGARQPFGNDAALPKPALAGSPFAFLLTTEEIVTNEGLRQKLLQRGWQTLGDIARHTLLEASEIASLTQEQREMLDALLTSLSLSLPSEQPAWVTRHRVDLRRRFQPELRALAAAIRPGVKAPVSVSTVFEGQPGSLNEELERLIPITYDLRNRTVLVSLFGLDGADPLTLEEISKRQTHPTSRERIRQIGLPFLRSLQTEGAGMLWLRRAMTLLRDEAPCPQLHAEMRLRASGIAATPLSVVAVLKLLDRAGLDHGLLIEGAELLPAELIDGARMAERRAHRDCARWGVADWQELSVPLARWGETARRLMPEATWLSASQRYFTFAERKNSLANRLARVLHVSPRICLNSAYAGLFRDPRVDSNKLPKELFPAFCAVWPWCRVEGKDVIAHGGLPDVYESGDDRLVLIIRTFGRPATREEIQAKAVREGISEATVSQSLKHSNVLTGVDGGYAVIGSDGCECC